jgi:hypothetical protein
MKTTLDTLQNLCRQDGVKSYIEPYGFGPLNDLDVGGKADINMGEFWMNREMTMVQSAVSASHIYGKSVTSAESFTSTPEINWKGNPAMAKISGDKAWAFGINEFMFHRFAHQANTHVKPGMTMNRWGFHFDRTQTWWENAGADWFQYMARGQYLLRQGVPVSDLLVFVGDASPNSVYLRKDFEPEIPAGTNFDCVNTDVLLVKNEWSRHKDIQTDEEKYGDFYLNTETSDSWRDPETGIVFRNEFTPVWRWRRAMYNDFLCRMDWCVKDYENANHAPLAAVNGDHEEKIHVRDCKVGEIVSLDASATSDPDGDELSYNWWIYQEAGSYPQSISISENKKANISIKIPDDAKGKTIHVILEVKDLNEIADLFDYRRIVLNVD